MDGDPPGEEKGGKTLNRLSSFTYADAFLMPPICPDLGGIFGKAIKHRGLRLQPDCYRGDTPLTGFRYGPAGGNEAEEGRKLHRRTERPRVLKDREQE